MVEAQEGSPKPAQTETLSRPQPNFLIPTCDMTFKEIERGKPEISWQMQIILEEVEKQALENFKINESTVYPGVSFSSTTISVTPQIVKQIASQNPDSSISQIDLNQLKYSPKTRLNVGFGPFAPPPEGHALGLLDMAIDRFTRNLARIAQAMKKGEPIPKVEIITVGTPVGYGGKVTGEYLKDLIKDGFETNGKLFGEFLNEVTSEVDLENLSLLVQGASMGTVNADKAASHLPQTLRDKTLVLLDAPAGHHSPHLKDRWKLKGTQTIVGFGAETIVRMASDRRLKGQGKRTKDFYTYLEQTKNIPKDNRSQTMMKWAALGETAFRLGWGSEIDTEHVGTTLRSGIYDPLTARPSRIFEIRKKINQPVETHYQKRRKNHPEEYHDETIEYLSPDKSKINMPIQQRGKALEFPYSNSHYWFYTRRFNRWQKIIEYCQDKNKSLEDGTKKQPL
jgi:hypothetical protein